MVLIGEFRDNIADMMAGFGWMHRQVILFNPLYSAA